MAERKTPVSYSPRPGCETLRVTAGGRCERYGLKMFGHHFTTDEPTDVKVSELGQQKASRILRHGDLNALQLDASGKLIGKAPEAHPQPPAKKPASFTTPGKEAKSPQPTSTMEKPKRRRAPADGS